MFKGYRTIILAIFLTILGVLEAADLTPFLPTEWKPYAPIFLPMIFGVLRLITTTPVGQKDESP